MCQGIRCNATRWLVCHVVKNYGVPARTVRDWAKKKKELGAARLGKRSWSFDPKKVQAFMLARGFKEAA